MTTAGQLATESTRRDAAPQPYLIVCTDGPLSGQAFPLPQGRLIVGRSSDADITVPCATVSRRHLEICSDGAFLRFSDLGSKNPPRLNGTPLRGGQLVSGDRLVVGPCELLIVLDARGRAIDESPHGLASPATKADEDEPWLETEERSLPVIEGIELLSELGSGAMGVVYRGRQLALDRLVAVKIFNLAGDVTSDVRQSFERRFSREARLLAQLDHPHIVRCFDAGSTVRGAPYVATELIGGPDAERYVEGAGPLAPGPALRITAEVARALQYAWKRGLIHRDVKAANVLLEPTPLSKDGLAFRARLTDFGLVKALRRESSHQTTPLTMQGMLVGTPHTMAPEQAVAPQSIDHRADIYGLGCTLYHLLAGELPFADIDDPAQVLVQKVRGAEPAIDSVSGGAAIHALLRHMLATRPSARPASYEDLLEAIARAGTE